MGYTGSAAKNRNPTYRNIQDFAEAIRITYDPAKLSYEDLLDLFFDIHTPSDPRFAGTQYRSAIFYSSEEQKQLAEAATAKKGALGKYVAIEPSSDFYRAEEYHQKYLDKMKML